MGCLCHISLTVSFKIHFTSFLFVYQSWCNKLITGNLLTNLEQKLPAVHLICVIFYIEKPFLKIFDLINPIRILSSKGEEVVPTQYLCERLKLCPTGTAKNLKFLYTKMMLYMFF